MPSQQQHYDYTHNYDYSDYTHNYDYTLHDHDYNPNPNPNPNPTNTNTHEQLKLNCSTCHRNEIALLSNCISNSIFIGVSSSSSTTSSVDDVVVDVVDHVQSLHDQYAYVLSKENTRNIITTISCIATNTTNTDDAAANDSTVSSSASNYKKTRSSLGFSYAVSEVWCACCQANLGRAIEMQGKSTSTILLQKSKVETH